MLSEKEKREMLEDGTSPTRREVFKSVRLAQQRQPMSQPDYLKFLDNVHRVFGHPKPRHIATKTDKNLL